MKRYIKSDNDFNDFKDTLEDVGYEEEWIEDNDEVETFEEANPDFKIPTIEINRISSDDFNYSKLIHKYGFKPFFTQYHNCCVAQSNHKFLLYEPQFPHLFTVVSGYSSLNEMKNILKQWYDFDNEMLGNTTFDYTADKAGYDVESANILTLINLIWG